MHKKDRRDYFRQLQKSFTTPQFQHWNEALGPNLLKVAKAFKPKSMVAVYQARPREADLSPLFSLPLHFCFPRVLSKNGEMEFRLVEKPADKKEYEKGTFGILQPTPKHTLVQKKDIHVCFVPLLAFDAEGQRLGQGMGFYDRFLAGFTGKKIGVGYEWQFSKDALPVAEFDQKLDLIVTEHKIHEY